MKNCVLKIEISRDCYIFWNFYDKREGFENMYKYIVVCLLVVNWFVKMIGRLVIK